VVVAFDGDQAGRHASVRAYDRLREAQVWPSTLALPAGQDPASHVLEHGAPGLRAALLAADGTPLADLVVDERIARHELRWAEGQVAAGRDASTVVAAMPPEHVPRQILRVIAQTGLSARQVSDLVVDAVTDPGRPRSTTGSTTAGTTKAGSPPAAPRSTAAAPSRPATDLLRPPGVQTEAVPVTSQSAAQRARAGFPVALKASLRPPAPDALAASPPPCSPPDQSTTHARPDSGAHTRRDRAARLSTSARRCPQRLVPTAG
jgi:DNA primase